MAPVAPAAAQTKMSETKADLEALQQLDARPARTGAARPRGFHDPRPVRRRHVEANIGWFRHAEIKHGRAPWPRSSASYIAGCTPLVSGEHAVAPYRGYVAGGTPFEQWDNMPLLAKAQIFTTIGMLES